VLEPLVQAQSLLFLMNYQKFYAPSSHFARVYAPSSHFGIFDLYTSPCVMTFMDDSDCNEIVNMSNFELDFWVVHNDDFKFDASIHQTAAKHEVWASL
jgi:hypothetical protein